MSRQCPDTVLIAPRLGERSHVLAVALEESGFTGMPASEATSQLVYPRRPVVLLLLARRGFSPLASTQDPAPNGPRQSSNALRLQLLPSDTCGLATAWEQFQHSPKSVERPRKSQTAGAPPPTVVARTQSGAGTPIRWMSPPQYGLRAQRGIRFRAPPSRGHRGQGQPPRERTPQG